MERDNLITLLEHYFDKYDRPGFVEDDPISIPHGFQKKADREIMGFFAAILAWGQRKTTINKCRELAGLMDGAPHDFVCNHRPADLRRMEHFVHRTFNSTDLLYFLAFFARYYREHDSLEDAFLDGATGHPFDMKASISGFSRRFFSMEHVPARTRRHIASPERNSSCKRLNMYLRWMVRDDGRGVDMGLWKRIPMSALRCPLDVHVERSARRLGLLDRRQRDWKAVEELTANLRAIDPHDPVRFDFALFGMGLEGAV